MFRKIIWEGLPKKNMESSLLKTEIGRADDWRKVGKGQSRAQLVLSKETGKSFDVAAIDNWRRNHKKKGKTAA